MPTTSTVTSAPPLVSWWIFVTVSSLLSKTSSAPSSLALSNFASSRSTAITLEAPLNFNAWITNSPIMPAPITTAVLDLTLGMRLTPCNAIETGSTNAASSNDKLSGSL